MKNEKKKKKLAMTTLVVRGLLAGSSDNADDPYNRVILKCAEEGKITNKGREGGVVKSLQIDQLDFNSSPDDMKRSISMQIDQYVKQYGDSPVTIILKGLGLLSVQKEDPAAVYPLRNKVALVTGAAGAIGAGICRGLLEKGAHVAATDVDQEKLDDLTNELKGIGGDRIIGIQMDVTDKDSIRLGFEKIIFTWGGVDVVVVNAGIAMVAPLVDMDIEAFRRLEKVNIEGTLLTLAEAGRCLTMQGTGGDIVLVSSKNVFAPGAHFGAYSATKAASHQLARIASLELAQFGIRVNMVSPDAVFADGKRKSGLWAEVGPSRMKARGLDEKGLEEYYRNRNLLKARITSVHVANAVLFFVTRQTPTTGATIPVDGGVPEAAPR
ncbi:MAG: SDR family NAD(P)-dependent oxidoreductase [Kiritimatiellae bacterium]|nr:SDR family NAD(P)-dependent oxidoreductase [Kiritimatiellia bacterium]MDD5520974.1 SDR family NAD(P)-dependent oxidoreductase [Kiritimatiellia bacterium]